MQNARTRLVEQIRQQMEKEIAVAMKTHAVVVPSNEKKQVFYKYYDICGIGGFGVVVRGKFRTDGQPWQPCAIKRVFQDKRYFNRELHILRQLRHRHVAQLLCFFYGTAEHHEGVYLNMFFEYYDTSLRRLLDALRKSGETLPLQCIARYTEQLCSALAYIHSKTICHRDIKPGNILLDRDRTNVYLCDFGISKHLHDDQPNISYICTRFYRAPENILGHSKYTLKIDVWSLGCVVAEMVTGTVLFFSDCKKYHMETVVSVIGSPDTEDAHALAWEYRGERRASHLMLAVRSASEQIRRVVARALVYSPARRASAEELLALCRTK